MNLLPIFNETLVSPLSGSQLLEEISRQTKTVNYLDKRSLYQNREAAFNGTVGQDSFRISRAIQRSNTFLALLVGKVENSQRGSILFVRYRLFPGALFFLIFWSLILGGLGAYFLVFTPESLSGWLSLGLGLLNYSFTLIFFHRQVQVTRREFHRLIDIQLKE